MNRLVRVKKLEEKNNSDEVDLVLFIDDITTYKGNTYESDDFYRLYPHFKDAKTLEIK